MRSCPLSKFSMEGSRSPFGGQGAPTASGRLEVDDLTSTPGPGASPGLQSTIQMQLARSLFTRLSSAFSSCSSAHSILMFCSPLRPAPRPQQSSAATDLSTRTRHRSCCRMFRSLPAAAALLPLSATFTPANPLLCIQLVVHTAARGSAGCRRSSTSASACETSAPQPRHQARFSPRRGGPGRQGGRPHPPMLAATPGRSQGRRGMP
jgi:hypothetical protein